MKSARKRSLRCIGGCDRHHALTVGLTHRRQRDEEYLSDQYRHHGGRSAVNSAIRALTPSQSEISKYIEEGNDDMLARMPPPRICETEDWETYYRWRSSKPAGSLKRHFHVYDGRLCRHGDKSRQYSRPPTALPTNGLSVHGKRIYNGYSANALLPTPAQTLARDLALGRATSVSEEARTRKLREMLFAPASGGPDSSWSRIELSDVTNTQHRDCYMTMALAGYV